MEQLWRGGNVEEKKEAVVLAAKLCMRMKLLTRANEEQSDMSMS